MDLEASGGVLGSSQAGKRDGQEHCEHYKRFTSYEIYAFFGTHSPSSHHPLYALLSGRNIVWNYSSAINLDGTDPIRFPSIEHARAEWSSKPRHIVRVLQKKSFYPLL